MGLIEITVDVTVDGEYLAPPASRTVDMDAVSTPWLWVAAEAAGLVRASRDAWHSRLDMDGEGTR